MGSARRLMKIVFLTVSGPRPPAIRNARNSCPVVGDNESQGIPRRLWWALVEKAAGLDRNKRWADLSNLQARALARALVQCPLDLVGKGTFKDEFVTAGGVSLTAIDMKTMQCMYRPGLFVCGELINVDRITVGYNFMNWPAHLEQRQQPETLWKNVRGDDDDDDPVSWMFLIMWTLEAPRALQWCSYDGYPCQLADWE
jgi:hypothetical protein